MSAVRRCGEGALLVECGDDREAMRLWRLLDRQPPTGVVEVVLGAVTVLVLGTVSADLAARLSSLRVADEPHDDHRAASESAVVELPVRYDGADLGAVATAVGLTETEVVRRHSAVEYTVGFAGFAPGFAYLTGLDPALHLPRRPTPRPRVPRGAVAIADRYTGVYPTASPGGWHLLGTTDAVLFDTDASPPALFRPGVRVRFVPA